MKIILTKEYRPIRRSVDECDAPAYSVGHASPCEPGTANNHPYRLMPLRDADFPLSNQDSKELCFLYE
jgi:hypothetical protein